MLNYVKKAVLPIAVAVMLVGCSEKDEAPVATIYGEHITEAQLNEKLTQQYGMEVLDQLVSNKVIELEAKKQKVTIEESAITEEYERYIADFEGEEELKKLLSSYKMTTDDVKYDIKIFLLTQKLMEDYLALSEEDVKAYFEEYKTVFTEDDAPLEEVRDEVYAALLEQRMNEQYEKWINELYEQDDITTTFYTEET